MVRVDGMQGNSSDNPKRVIHELTPEEKNAGSIFTNEIVAGFGPNQDGIKLSYTYKDLNGDGLITEDELQSVTRKNYDEEHKLVQANLYKDVNSDGKLDLYTIDKYFHFGDGTMSVIRHKDRDGDGYSDEYTLYEYDNKKNMTSKNTTAEENINSVKNRPHLEHEVFNRQMNNLDNGNLMM